MESDLSGGPVLLSFSLATACFAFSTTFVRLFCVRRSITKHFGVDDYASGAATVVALVGTIFGGIEATAREPARALEFDVLGQPWYLMSATLSMISICLFFNGMLGRARHWRILLSVLIVCMAAVNLSFSMTVNLQCRPLEKLWNPAVEGVCWDPSVQLNFGFFQGAFAVFSWFFLALFPILIVRHLRFDANVTWPFYVTSALSFTCGIFSIVKTAQTAQTSGRSVYTYNTFCASLMANLEQNLGLIAANALTLGPLFTPRSSSSRRNPTGGSSSSSSSNNSRGLRKTKTPSRAGSTRPITRSLSSSRRTASRGSIRDSSSVIDLKRTTHLIIQGPAAARVSMDEDDLERGGSGNSNIDFAGFSGFGGGGFDIDEYDLGEGFGRRRSSFDNGDRVVDDGFDLDAWPRGIIKTVSVEVVDEPNPDHVPSIGTGGNAIGGPSASNKPIGAGLTVVRSAVDSNERQSGASVVEQDWEAMLRAGPPGR